MFLPYETFLLSYGHRVTVDKSGGVAIYESNKKTYTGSTGYSLDIKVDTFNSSNAAKNSSGMIPYSSYGQIYKIKREQALALDRQNRSDSIGTENANKSETKTKKIYTIANNALDFVHGTVDALDNDLTNGFSQAVTHDILNRYHMNPQTPAYKLGRITGDVGVTIKGVGEVVLGGSGEIAGTCLDATGVGSVAGIPINIASAAVAADGAVSITGGVKGLLNDTVSLFEGNSSTSSANNTVQNANKVTDKGMLGKNGTQVTSKTVWQNGKTERIDIENPNPGQRAGDIHYHDANNTKYRFDPSTKKFYDECGELAPNKVQNLLKDKNFQKNVDKGLNILGEKALYRK